MKKNLNTFKAVNVNNAVRYLIIFCIVLVVGAIVLFASLPENRGSILGWFGAEPTVTRKDTANEMINTEDVGLTGTAVINENLAVRPLSSEDHLLGNIGAPVQMIIYEDFQCPFCAQLYDSVEQAKAEFGSDLVIAVRHYPLSNHELAIPAAQASECAADQNKFWDMYHELFRQNKASTMTLDTIKSAAVSLKLDESAYIDCLTKEPDNAKILSEKEEVKKLGVIGTPASFLNGEYIAGALPYDDFTHPDGTNALGLRSMIKQKLQK